MNKISVYETADKVLHRDFDSAHKHANKRYGNKLTKLTTVLLQQTKYKSMVEFIDANLNEFVSLKDLKVDIELENTLGLEEEDIN